ncbi:uncharacterized protein LOC124369635 [Homalodisca vitripennis]|uniref:uncharacterized protein LOC124369635 n=1 Tax=Homalodisca vitripennis TaxID=197043 RepID=UPI001EECA5FB|nr:uncharacterized protein LOC124369635 [Homalodisca vitripennis]
MFSLLCCCGLLVLSPVSAWDLSPLLQPAPEVSHVTLFGSRAFLSLSRHDEQQKYSLVEATWPERPRPFLSYIRPFPNKELQMVGNCSHAQRPVSTDWDGISHLVVLDAGWQNTCSPKVLIYHIFTNKQVSLSQDLLVCKLFLCCLQWQIQEELQRTQTKSVIREIALQPVRVDFECLSGKLTALVVDTVTLPIGTRAYMGETRPGKLAILDLPTGRWWEVSLSTSPFIPPVTPSSSQLALSGHHLYLASHHSDTLFRLNLTDLRSSTPSSSPNNQTVDTKLEGTLLGPPRGLVVDPRGSLYYCLARDYVCVSWDIHRPLRAESHRVLLQSADLLPRVHQLFLDLQKQVWALTDNNNGSHCVHISRPVLLYPNWDLS